MLHSSGHLIAGAVALATALAISSLTLNRYVKRKLRLSLFLFAAYLILNAVAVAAPAAVPLGEANLLSLERLALAAGIINLLVVSLVNPLRHDRIPDRFPTILQDFMVIGLVLLVATFVSDTLVTTSAVSAVVLGFALQDTLGNAFAGLAIQSEKPFHVGHWIRVGDFEGRVTEVTWRATKLRTKAGNFVVLPNNIVSKEAITNFSEPVVPTRLEVEVGASYLSAPNLVRTALLEAMANARHVLKTPPPGVELLSFGDSAINYRARFWIDDYESDDTARNDVRTAIYYAFSRHGIDIPFPIQVQYNRDWPQSEGIVRQHEREQLLASVDLFASLDPERRSEIALATKSRVYGNGEAIVRQGEPGQSMYVIGSGAAVVVLEPDRREVAKIEAGGYFGEMSLLTGEPRTATVLARGDTVVMEIDAEQFRTLGDIDPRAVEQIGMAAMNRRLELEASRSAAAGATVADQRATFLSRMRKFLRL
jgi:small-conductance mechanosensitive channel/CRP-like cAMP-binding protein